MCSDYASAQAQGVALLASACHDLVATIGSCHQAEPSGTMQQCATSLRLDLNAAQATRVPSRSYETTGCNPNPTCNACCLLWSCYVPVDYANLGWLPKYA